MPDEMDGGVVSMRFRNTGEETHEFALGRIDGGHTIDETIRDLFANDGRVPYATDIGGVPLLSPGEEITITRRLEPGTYGLLGFFPSPDGKSHLGVGMKREFRVSGGSAAQLPEPDAVVTATATGFEVPEFYWTDHGCVPGWTSMKWQRLSLGLLKGRLFSDNLGMFAVKRS